MAEEQHWGRGRAREEGTFLLFLKEERGEQKGVPGQDSGGCRECGGLSAEKGTDVGFQAPCPGGRVWYHLLSSSAFLWATPGRSPCIASGSGDTPWASGARGGGAGCGREGTPRSPWVVG